MQPLPLLLAIALSPAWQQPPATTARPGRAPQPGIARIGAAAEARLREETVDSAALGRQMKYRVLLPQDYDASLRRYPVLYLLHGLTGDYKDWTTRTNLAEYTRALPLIVVMPDGENSWYTNDASDPSSKFETYIVSDLVQDVEGKFRAIRSRYGRAIAGLSMGGYGSLKMALKQPGLFAFAGSMSGALAVARDAEFGGRMGAEGERIARIFGPAGSQTRKENDVYAIAAAARPAAAPYLYMDCGTSDGLLASNRELVDAIGKAKLAYEYHELPGAHTWDYWDARIQEMLPLVMRKMAMR